MYIFHVCTHWYVVALMMRMWSQSFLFNSPLASGSAIGREARNDEGRKGWKAWHSGGKTAALLDGRHATTRGERAEKHGILEGKHAGHEAYTYANKKHVIWASLFISTFQWAPGVKKCHNSVVSNRFNGLLFPRSWSYSIVEDLESVPLLSCVSEPIFLLFVPIWALFFSIQCLLTAAAAAPLLYCDTVLEQPLHLSLGYCSVR